MKQLINLNKEYIETSNCTNAMFRDSMQTFCTFAKNSLPGFEDRLKELQKLEKKPADIRKITATYKAALNEVAGEMRDKIFLLEKRVIALEKHGAPTKLSEEPEEEEESPVPQPPVERCEFLDNEAGETDNEGSIDPEEAEDYYLEEVSATPPAKKPKKAVPTKSSLKEGVIGSITSYLTKTKSTKVESQDLFGYCTVCGEHLKMSLEKHLQHFCKKRYAGLKKK